MYSNDLDHKSRKVSDMKILMQINITMHILLNTIP